MLHRGYSKCSGGAAKQEACIPSNSNENKLRKKKTNYCTQKHTLGKRLNLSPQNTSKCNTPHFHTAMTVHKGYYLLKVTIKYMQCVTASPELT